MTGKRPLALVTGGCRRLGAAICIALGQAGYDIAIHSGPSSVPEPDLTTALDLAGARWAHVIADLAQEGAVVDLIPAVIEAWGRPPVLLVNNAARFVYDEPETATRSGLIEHYAVNSVAPVLLAQAMAALGRCAAIVNILDQRIAAPNSDQFSYTLSKLALSEATAILAERFAPLIRVSAVAPGLTLPTKDYDAAALARAAEKMPLGRLPSPREIADAVVYLAKASAVTGQTLFVDGGAHLCHYPRDFLFLSQDD